uniref:Ribosomal protein L23 n=1 Tax=Apicomplexa sp. corallicolid ex Leiopathes glaberrima TaxID=2720216 RepID=A0A6M3R5T8_9APIC|nr:ribosomal protein L23 [Apicomplexa sp. corallicolid ex Leiopathes glaberrima]
MVKEICNINLLSLIPKYYLTSKSYTQENKSSYTFLVPRYMDKPIIKLYLTTFFNIKIKCIKSMNLKYRAKNKRFKKVIVKFNKNLSKV